MGAYDATADSNWMNIAAPALQKRMEMYEDTDIEFNLMAVVHDSIVKDRVELLRNVKELQAMNKKLDEVFEDWRSLDGAETRKDVVMASSADFDVSQADVDAEELPTNLVQKIEQSDL